MILRVVFVQLLLALALQIACLNSFSQNVGIGTSTPSEKLEIRNPLRSTVKLSSNSFLDTTELLLSNRNITNQGTDFSIRSIREEGLAFSSLSDLAPNTSFNSLVIKPNGNIGINTYNPSQRLEVNGNSYFNGNVGVGTAAPTNKFEVTGNSVFNGFVGLGASPSVRLEIAGAVKLQGTNAFEFGSGIPGKEINGGKIGYQVFTADALDIVGAGTNSTNRKVKLWAEGGTILDGPISIGGPLQINGDAGVAGRVLTSNGAGAPQWKTTSFSNNTRFAVVLGAGVGGTAYATIFATDYNQNPTDIVIGSSSVTINHSGLYHFDVQGTGQLSYTATTIGYPSFSLYFYYGPPHAVPMVEDQRMDNYGNSYTTFYKCSRKESVEIYVSAPAAILVYYVLNTIGTGGGTYTTGFTGYLSGHLISD